MRPFSMCRTSWPTPKTKHATCPCAAGCRWSASQPAHRPRRRARARRASWAGPGAPRRSCSRWTGSSTSQQQPWCLCWTQPRSATAVQHKADGQQARDEQQQQRSGRREGRMQHDGAHEPACIAATSGASDAIAAAFRHRANIYLSVCLCVISVCLCPPLPTQVLVWQFVQQCVCVVRGCRDGAHG